QWTDEEWKLLEFQTPDLGGTLFPRHDDSSEEAVIEHTEVPEEVSYTPEVVSLGEVEDLSPDLVEQYFPETLEARVLDPQSLLTQSRMDGVLNFLEYHFREARSAIHIIVLRPNQRLPSHLDLRKIHEKWFGDTLTVLAVYNIGNPEMSRLIFGHEAERRVLEARRANACMEAINEAMVVSNAEDQLERFLTELSRRLYWIEDIYHGGNSSGEGAAAEPGIALAAPTEPVISRKRLWFTILSMATVVIMAGGSVVALQRRASGKTFYFPDRRHFPRLGGSCGGGNRLVVSFGKAKEERKIS
ncbi:MAG: hypothetical protein ACKVHP_20485, partial [Verrucomicrobiales bacterium]